MLDFIFFIDISFIYVHKISGLVDIRLENYYRTRKRCWIWLVIKLEPAFYVANFSGFHTVIVPPAGVGAAGY
jgi:hypothetical protein